MLRRIEEETARGEAARAAARNRGMVTALRRELGEQSGIDYARLLERLDAGEVVMLFEGGRLRLAAA